MSDRARTPPSQIPSASSTATSLPATPGGRRPFRPRTPGGSMCSPISSRISSPFPPRTPRGAMVPTTPGGGTTTTTCSSDAAAFTTVKVHTAKCSECDKRNMDTMRRCPGCTFQVCKPCYDRREKAGRNLAHGNMQSPAIPMTGGEASVVRRRPFGMVGTPGRVYTPGRDVQKEKESGEKNKEAAKATSTPRKRTAKPKKKAPLSDGSSGDDFVPDGDSPTSAKRHRILQGTPTATSIRSSRKQPTPTTIPKNNNTILPPTETDINLSTSVGFRPSTLSYDILMQAVGVNTPENPYQQHLLSRQNPIVSNPVIAIPDIIKRGFKPRPRATEILQNMHKQTNHATNVEKEDQQTTTVLVGLSQTIRQLITSKVTTYQQNTALDDDEKDELVSTVKEAGRKWAVQLFNNLPMTARKNMTRGLDMRLEHIEEAKQMELEKLVEDVAARKLRELVEGKGE